METNVVTVQFRDRDRDREIITDVLSTSMDSSVLTLRLDGETIVFPIDVIFKVSVTIRKD